MLATHRNSPRTSGSTCINAATIFSHETAMIDVVHHMKPPHPHLQLRLVLSVRHATTTIGLMLEPQPRLCTHARITTVAPSSNTRRDHHCCTKIACETCNSQYGAPLRLLRATISSVQHAAGNYHCSTTRGTCSNHANVAATCR